MASTFSGSDFPPAIAGLLQQGFLVRELEEGLDSILAYRMLAVQDEFPGNIGETMTKTRKGRKAPVSAPLPTSGNTALDNNLTPSAFTVEQYTFTLRMYGDTVDLNLMQNEAQIADQFVANARNSGVQAAQSLERICRQKLFNAYMGGNTRTIAAPTGGTIATNAAANGATNSNVDDIRGFQNVLVGGVVTPISNTNPLSCTLTKASDGTTITLTVTAATAFTYAALKSAANITTTPDAIPGFLTFTEVGAPGYTPLTGDAILASDAGNTAPAIFRPRGVLTMAQVGPADILSLGIIEDGVAYLRDNSVPTLDDGTYLCILDNTSMRQLFADQDFKIAYAGRSQSPELKDGDIVRLMGVTYVTTTEAYVQNQATFAANALTNSGIKIRRPIIAGAECIVQGNFEGMATFLKNIGMDMALSNVAMVYCLCQIVRPPLDRLSQIVSQSWVWVGDYAVPSDLTASNSIIPTASNSLFKRAAVIEHAG